MRFFRRLLPTALAVLSFALPGSALGQAPLSPDKAFALTVTREADGDLAFAWDIAPGHYLYRDHTVASTPGGKESLPLELAAGETKDDPGFGVVFRLERNTPGGGGLFGAFDALAALGQTGDFDELGADLAQFGSGDDHPLFM